MTQGNSVTLVGNTTRDPELRYTAAGQATAGFGIAVNRRWKNKQSDEWEERVGFFNVTTWAQLAENVADSVHKGDRVVVTGRLEQRSWETETGDKRSVVEIAADDVGPSLRWATAQVARNERTNTGGENQGGGGRGSAVASQQGHSAYDALGEEPF